MVRRGDTERRTDRVLYYSSKYEIRGRSYECLSRGFQMSDHRPVAACLEAHVDEVDEKKKDDVFQGVLDGLQKDTLDWGAKFYNSSVMISQRLSKRFVEDETPSRYRAKAIRRKKKTNLEEITHPYR